MWPAQLDILYWVELLYPWRILIHIRLADLFVLLRRFTQVKLAPLYYYDYYTQPSGRDSIYKTFAHCPEMGSLIIHLHLPQIVHSGLIKERMRNALPSTLDYG